MAETEETKVAMIDPATMMLVGMQVVNIIAKLMSPTYVPPTPAQIKEMIAKLENEPDLEIYKTPGMFEKFMEKVGLG